MAEQNSEAIPDFSFENRFFFENPLGKEREVRSKIKQLTIELLSIFPYSYNGEGDIIAETIEHELKTSLSFIDIKNYHNTIVMEMNTNNLAQFSVNTIEYSKYYRNVKHPTTLLFGYLFEIPIYVNEELGDKEILLTYIDGENE